MVMGDGVYWWIMSKVESENQVKNPVISATDLVFSKVEIPWQSAISEWQKALGTDRVVVDQEGLSQVGSATFATTQKVTAVLRPKDLEQVSQILQIASQFKAPVYPISKGRNWGFGSKVPVCEASAILDLQDLNRIVDYSEKYGYLIVEPGVSFSDCCQFLTDKKSNFFINVIGGPGDASVIGNVVERGDGIGPYSERFPFVSDFQVVLADGKTIETGFSAVKGSRVSSLCPFGIGPYVDGLFTQSNFGVVTRMTIWLCPIPKSFKLCSFSVESDDKFKNLIDRLRPLYLNRTLDAPIFFWNDYKQLAGMIQKPPTEKPAAMSVDILERYKKKYKFGKWNGIGGIYKSGHKLSLVTESTLRNAIRRNVDRQMFVRPQLLPLIRLFRPILRWVYPDIDTKIEMLRENPFLGQQNPLGPSINTLPNKDQRPLQILERLISCIKLY